MLPDSSKPVSDKIRTVHVVKVVMVKVLNQNTIIVTLRNKMK